MAFKSSALASILVSAARDLRPEVQDRTTNQ